MYKQIIIARKDLNMSAGKLAAQVSHASMAFISNMIRNNTTKICINRYMSSNTQGEPILYSNPSLCRLSEKARSEGRKMFCAVPKGSSEPFMEMIESEPICIYKTYLNINSGVYENWFKGSFTKCILEAKNMNDLLKAKRLAEDIGLVEGKDFFLIKDNCLTELSPEEVDENGIGRTLTCIGFAPMDAEIIDKVGKKFQLYK